MTENSGYLHTQMLTIFSQIAILLSFCQNWEIRYISAKPVTSVSFYNNHEEQETDTYPINAYLNIYIYLLVIFFIEWTDIFYLNVFNQKQSLYGHHK